MLECLYKLHENTGASICGCGFRSVTPEEARAEEQATGVQNDAEMVPRILNGAAIVKDAVFLRDTRVWSKLFTKELIGNQRFQKGLTIGEDMLFVVSLIREDTVYALLEQKKLYRYTVNPKGAMERPFTPSYMDQIRCWEEAERVLNRNLPELLKDKEARARLGALQPPRSQSSRKRSRQDTRRNSGCAGISCCSTGSFREQFREFPLIIG